MPVLNKTAYHLFDYENLKIISKPSWQPFHLGNHSSLPWLNCFPRPANITSFDFNSEGDKIATIDRYGGFLLTNTDKNTVIFQLELQEQFSSCNLICIVSLQLILLKFITVVAGTRSQGAQRFLLLWIRRD